MDSFSKIFALFFIISFLSISAAAAAATTPEADSDNPVTPQFFGFFRLIPKVLPLIPKIIGLPDLPLPPPLEEAQLHNNDLPVPVSQSPTCPIDTQKLGACMDLIGLRHSAMNKCCPIFDGLVEAEAAVCMCTTLKEKALDLKVFVPIALQLLAKCGKTPPPGYTCSLSI